MKIEASPRQGEAAGTMFFATDTGRTLLVKRADSGCDYPGHWCGVGGGMDAGETPAEAAMREAWEETGFRGEVNLVPVMREAEPGFTLYMFLGIVRSEFKPVLNDEHTEYAWVEDFDDLPDGDPIHPGTIRFVQFIADKNNDYR